MSYLQRTIILRGVVEGVGMRPALFRLAHAFGLHGSAVNSAASLELVLEGDPGAVEACCAALEISFPPGSRVEHPLQIRDRWIESTRGAFIIADSPANARGVNLLTPADRAMCPMCREETFNPADRRFLYAFNSCGECGPRASVIDALPYERRNTAWRDFPLCPDCRREYEDPADRRFHIEGISCPRCGPRLDGNLAEAAEMLKKGGLLALKGVGGFHLLADPRSPEAVKRLRVFKHRPRKPLALMARSLEILRRNAVFDMEEEKLLASPEAPVVLLHFPEEPWPAVNPDRPWEIGVMLPSSPLHEILFHHFDGDFLIATSGNRASEPPALDGKEARRNLEGVDFVVDHNREILWRHDDSLAVVHAGTPQFWRRGRGAPWRIDFRKLPFDRRVLALGGALKNTFAFTGGGALLLSPHHGELEDAATELAWEHAVQKTLEQLTEAPEVLAFDLHPDYASAIFGRKLANKLGIPAIAVPHHYAHALAGWLEDGAEEEILALVFDGNGLGPDGLLWGAELLFVGPESGRRLATFAAAPLPGGERAIREPYRQLAGRRFAAGLGTDPEIDFQCRNNVNAPQSHAAGRLFDAFSAHIGIAPARVSYEGQAAILLESRALREGAWSGKILPWREDIRSSCLYMDWTPLFLDTELSATPALDFHRTLACAAKRMADYGRARTGGRRVLLTGGVFQNRLLTRLVLEELRRSDFEVILPSLIPPNDAGLAAGQCVWSGLHFRISGVNYSRDETKEKYECASPIQ